MSTIEDKLRLFFEKEENVVSLHLFGSYAKGSANENSDVDVAVLFLPGNVPGKMEQLDLSLGLSDVLEKEVDLVCLNEASPILGMQVQKYGKELLLNHPRIYYDYVMRLFTEYFDLKILRRPMEKAILERKYFS